MDTLAATQALEGKGYSRDQAEALVGLLHATISSDLVTKAELAASEARLADRIERAQATIERSLAVLIEKMGTVEARLSQRLTEELRSVDERIGKEVRALDQRLGQETQALDERIREEFRTLNQRIGKEARALDERIGTEVRTLDERIREEGRTLDQRVTQEVRRLDDRLVKVERELAVQAWYVRGAFAMVAAIFLRVYWEPVARTLKLLP